MATETLPAPRGASPQPAATHAERLFDVVALLAAAADRIEDPSDLDSHQTVRLVQMAREFVEEIANSLFLAESAEVSHG